MRIFFFLCILVSPLFLSGCFEKKEQVKDQTSELQASGSQVDEAPSSVPFSSYSQPLPPEESASSTAIQKNTSQDITPSLSGADITTQQKEIVQDAEENLEALFGDLMKSE